MADDVRFKSHGLAPKSAADFAFLLHGFHYLQDEGVMAIILPHGVLFRGGAEERIVGMTNDEFGMTNADHGSRSAGSPTMCSSSTPPSS
jgi:type I restriction-modification system DNA methylase subunit